MFASLSSCYDNSADQGTDIQTAEPVPAAGAPGSARCGSCRDSVQPCDPLATQAGALTQGADLPKPLAVGSDSQNPKELWR